ncbi:MAG TPA: FAD-dependent oxidoreductase, partial [Armatimonadota bacterium]|nr:FAD-dependent oxidoreductase [Armatimonadota bacterium]
RITPRRGEYCLFDKAAGGLVKKTVFQLPSPMGKGVLVTPTVDGNLLMGPTAVDQTDKDDTSTTVEGLDTLLKKAALSLDAIPAGQTITSFAGLRAHCETDDFIIGEASDAPNFINAAGIESPGLSCAPAIGSMLADMVAERLHPAPNQAFNPVRKGIPKFRELDNDARAKLIAENPAFGKIICRCETVTEGEILEAIHRPLGATTLDGVKRRTRAGMGRCQSGFCSTRVLELLAKELKQPYTSITKSGGGSYLLVGVNKQIDQELIRE